MNQLQNHDEFVSNLLLEKEAIMAFTEILEKERCTLIKGSIDKLDYFSASKERIVKKLTDYGQKRSQYLISQGLPPNSAGVEKLLTTKELRTKESIIWAESLQLAGIAQQINHTNGVIIAMRMRHSQRALTALQCAAGTISLYGSNGQCVMRCP